MAVRKTTMNIYHGSPEIVSKPEIRIDPERAMDFGQGFYCTTSRTQAEKWAKAKIRKGKYERGYVNEYIFYFLDNSLKIKKFENEPTIEWLDFVVANRTNPLFENDYDIIIGPIANDDAFSAIETFVAQKDHSVQKKMELIKTLKTYKLKDQILFRTDKALKTLQFKATKEIKQKHPIVIEKQKKGRKL